MSYQGKTLNYFYTYYMHLDDSQTPAYIKDARLNGAHPLVPAGHVIAHTGNSGQGPGEEDAIHLHFELRAGTQSSLQFQKAAYSSNSPSYYGFDPHMHPLLLFEPVTNRMTLALLEETRNDQDRRILFTALPTSCGCTD